MRWITRGRQLGQAVKNVQRLRQIVAVFARHGYADLVYRMDLGRFLPGSWTQSAQEKGDLPLQVHLRQAFEELGPTFVKFGQILSTRADLIPEEFAVELTKLQDNVQPLPYETVKAVVEKELKGSIDQLFQSVNPTPLASASIAQVHEAVLLTGDTVVIKVQRPDIERSIQQDIALMGFIAGLLEKYVSESRIVQPKLFVNEFFRTLSYELDFNVEANNMAKITHNLRDNPEVVVPKVYKNLSCKRVLTLEKFNGIRVNDPEALDRAGVDRTKIVQIGARAFFRSIMIDGLFHGDLHGGNLFVLPGNRLGIIDFGVVGRLSDKSRTQLANIVLALVNEDYENLCYQYADLGAASASVDFDGFQRDLRATISPYLGLTLNDVNMGRVLMDATGISARYQIRVPGEWMLVFKSILTVEGMGRSLDPHFDFFNEGQSLIKDLVKDQYSVEKFTKDLLWVAKDSAALLQTLPRQIRWMFRKFSSNDFAFELKIQQIDEVKHEIDMHGRRTSLSIMVAGLFIASSLALNSEAGHKIWNYPIISVVYFGFGCFLLFRIFLRSFK